jgi:hypothetical protein
LQTVVALAGREAYEPSVPIEWLTDCVLRHFINQTRILMPHFERRARNNK